MQKNLINLLLMVTITGMAPGVIANTTEGDEKWHYSLSPLFLWGQGIEGSSAIGPSSLPLDVTFEDALDNLEATFTFHFEARKGDLSLLAEYQYVDLNPSSSLPNGSILDIGFKSTLGELGAAYRVARYDRTDLEVLGGVRYVEQDLSAKGAPPPLSSVEVKEDWWDAFFGLRVQTRISDKWSFIGRADYGFGGSDSTWNLVGMFDYRFRDWGSFFVGYKWMDFDYSNGSGLDHYAYDATQQGPLVALRFYW